MEANKSVKWYDNEISMGIMKKKYLHEGEKPEDFIPRVTSIFSDSLRPKAVEAMDNADILPAGRTLFGAGYKDKRNVSLSNCYVYTDIDDTLESIYGAARDIARIGSYGGGVGFSLDKLRPKGSIVNNSAKESTGAVSFLHLFDTTGNLIGQSGRHMALLACISVDHPDSKEFMEIKNNHNQLASMNLSIKFTNEFMEAVKKGKDFTQKFISPHETIENTVNAKDFFWQFCETQWDWGDPGALFIDNMRRYNLLSGYPEYIIDSTNPCAEFSGNHGNSCNLGSINLYNVIDDKFTDKAHVNYDKLKELTETGVRMLDEILDYGYDMQPLELNRRCIDDWRSIGLGVFGLADAFVALGIKYGSTESRLLTGEIMDCIFAKALETSAYIAKEKGTFKKYDWLKTKESPLIKQYMNEPLYNLIQEYGLAHGTLLSIAPTGTISLFAGRFTGGIEPMFKIGYARTSHSMENSGKTFYVYARGVEDLLKFHGMDPESTPISEIKEKFPFVVESQEVDPMDRVALQGMMQNYVDNSISSTINLPNSATVEDIYKIYIEAYNQGCKGITVFRDGCKRGNILGVEEPKKEKVEEEQEPIKVPPYNSIEPVKRRNTKRVTGCTFRESTACCPSMYVTVNTTGKDNNIFEIFTNSDGGCKANIGTISRLISLALRCGIKVSKVIEELRSNQCPACQLLRRQGKNNISLSCGNAIADALEAMDKTDVIIKSKVKKAESKEAEHLLECPECHQKTLIPEGKCVSCRNCGYSRCD